MSRELSDYWENMEQAHEWEPMTESIYFDDVKKAIIEHLKQAHQATQADIFSSKVLIGELMIEGAKDYLWSCMAEEKEELDPIDNEKEFDDRDRARDLKDALKVFY